MTQETLIEFPAQIAIKAMGLHQDEFEQLVTDLVFPHIDTKTASVTRLLSKGGKYLSVSVHFLAADLPQLHTIYAALKQEPRVLYIL